MAQKDNILDLDTIRVNIGLSAIIGVTVVARESAIMFSKVSGGSLLYGGASMTHETGYIWQGAETSLNLCGTIYFAAVGSTVVLQMVKGLT